MSDQDNEERGIALAVVAGVVLLAISLAIGVALFRTGKGAAGIAPAASTAAATGGVVGGAAGAAGAAASGLAGGVAAPAGGMPATAAGSSTGAAVGDGPSIRVENGVVKFYFATGKAELAQGGNEALADVVAGIKAGQRGVISGYTDATGDADKNAELAKQRAFAVRDALVALGVSADKLELKKPEAVENTGNNAAARRVEVVLAK